MHSNNEFFSDIIVQAFDHGPHRMLIKYPVPIKDYARMDYSFFDWDDADMSQVVALPAGWEGNEFMDRHTIFAVTPMANEFEFAVCDLFSDNESLRGLDFIVSGRWQVVNPEAFLLSFALSVAYPNAPLRRKMAESWINYIFLDLFRREAASSAPSSSGARAAMNWFNKNFEDSLLSYGIKFEALNVAFENSDSTRNRVQKKLEEDFLKLNSEKSTVFNLYLRKKQVQLQYEDRKHQIVAQDPEFTEAIARELEELERKRCQDMLLAEIKVGAARFAWVKLTLQHESGLAHIRNQFENVKRTMSKLYRAEREHKKIMAFYTQAQQLLSKIARIKTPMLALLAGPDEALAHQAAERLTSAEFNFSPEGLIALGYNLQSQVLIQFFKRKSITDGEPVRIQNSSFTKGRDAGGLVPAKTLRINSPIKFEFSSQREGFVTVLNISTSGSVYVHVPNYYVGLEQASVQKDTLYSMPGDEFIPAEKLLLNGLDYVETGPQGWEHICVVISQKPVLSPEVFNRASASEPFVKLSQQEFDEICIKFLDMPSPTWTVNFISFIVLGD